MFTSDLKEISQAAVEKYEISKKQPKKYFMRSIAAGFYLMIAIILSNVTAAVMYSTYPEVGKVLSALLFPIGIALIIFVGAELFTGNNMTMAIGVYEKRCTWIQAIRVWVFSYIGNFIGCIVFAFLLYKSNASFALLETYFSNIIMGKLELTSIEFVFRGIICNFMVCVACLVAIRMKSEIGKLIVMFFVIMSFAIAGFEHSIANMGLFSVAYFVLGQLPMNLVFKSMFFVTIGNIIGGAFLLAWPLKIMAISDDK